ncbi:TPA: hypothetical protein N0F65_000186, partial [Lagenidium giganteum]
TQLFSIAGGITDLNLIENLWGVLARAVYQVGCQFTTKEELKVVVAMEWNKITMAYIMSLIDSMPKRCLEIVVRKGAKTQY